MGLSNMYGSKNQQVWGDPASQMGGGRFNTPGVPAQRGTAPGRMAPPVYNMSSDARNALAPRSNAGAYGIGGTPKGDLDPLANGRGGFNPDPQAQMSFMPGADMGGGWGSMPGMGGAKPGSAGMQFPIGTEDVSGWDWGGAIGSGHPMGPDQFSDMVYRIPPGGSTSGPGGGFGTPQDGSAFDNWLRGQQGVGPGSPGYGKPMGGASMPGQGVQRPIGNIGGPAMSNPAQRMNPAGSLSTMFGGRIGQY